MNPIMNGRDVFANSKVSEEELTPFLGGTSAELTSQKTRPRVWESGFTVVIQTNKLLHVQISFKSVYSSTL